MFYIFGGANFWSYGNDRTRILDQIPYPFNTVLLDAQRSFVHVVFNNAALSLKNALISIFETIIYNVIGLRYFR